MLSLRGISGFFRASTNIRAPSILGLYTVSKRLISNTPAILFQPASTDANKLKRSVLYWAEMIMQKPNPRCDTRRRIASELLSGIRRCNSEADMIRILNSKSKSCVSESPLISVLTLEKSNATESTSGSSILSVGEILEIASDKNKVVFKK